MRELPLSKGYVALVDDEDFERVRHIHWHAKLAKQLYVYGRSNTHGLLHRFILGVTDPGVHVDHQDGNTLDNRRENLRIASPKENVRSRHRVNGRSGVRGVRFDHRKWRGSKRWYAYITVDRRRISIGNFATLDEASAARRAATRKYFGEFSGTV